MKSYKNKILVKSNLSVASIHSSVRSEYCEVIGPKGLYLTVLCDWSGNNEEAKILFCLDRKLFIKAIFDILSAAIPSTWIIIQRNSGK